MRVLLEKIRALLLSVPRRSKSVTLRFRAVLPRVSTKKGCCTIDYLHDFIKKSFAIINDGTVHIKFSKIFLSIRLLVLVLLVLVLATQISSQLEL